MVFFVLYKYKKIIKKEKNKKTLKKQKAPCADFTTRPLFSGVWPLDCKGPAGSGMGEGGSRFARPDSSDSFQRSNST
jgi:hypothetical protein